MKGSFTGACAALLLCAIGQARAVASGSTNILPHEVYVWQRAWSRSVRDAVAEHGPAFSNLVVLAAELSWKPGEPQVARAHPDYRVLASVHRPVGLALRIGPYAGPFSDRDKAADAITALARSLVAEAAAEGIQPAELQIDFDCASSRLEGYARWIRSLRPALAPVPLTITALPVWLDEPAFRPLVAATDGFVLQVHSLERPKSFAAAFTSCDPGAARAAVAKAATFGVPFRVALPTYGYLMAFAANGQFVGLSAEGPAKNWPADARLREVRSDPIVMAELVQEWTAQHPAGLRGFLWYRLPVAVDNLNWRWPTLSAIIAPRSPRESVRAESRRVEVGLVEINLVNDGDLDISSRLALEIHWQDARLVAGDGLQGFRMAEVDASAARLMNDSQPTRLYAGESRTIGWLRFNRNVEVQLELKRR